VSSVKRGESIKRMKLAAAAVADVAFSKRRERNNGHDSGMTASLAARFYRLNGYEAWHDVYAHQISHSGGAAWWRGGPWACLLPAVMAAWLPCLLVAAGDVGRRRYD